jgi:hypothetical protein
VPSVPLLRAGKRKKEKSGNELTFNSCCRKSAVPGSRHMLSVSFVR